MAHRRVDGPGAEGRFTSDDPDLWLTPDEQAEIVYLVERARIGDGDALQALGRFHASSIYHRLKLGARVPVDAAEVAVRSEACKRRVEAIWAWAKVRGIPTAVAAARFGLEDTYP